MAVPLLTGIQSAAGVGQVLGGLFGNKKAKKAREEADKQRRELVQSIRDRSGARKAFAGNVLSEQGNFNDLTRNLAGVENEIEAAQGSIFRGLSAGSRAANLGSLGLQSEAAKGDARSRFRQELLQRKLAAGDIFDQARELTTQAEGAEAGFAEERAQQRQASSDAFLNAGITNLFGAAEAFDINQSYDQYVNQLLGIEPSSEESMPKIRGKKMREFYKNPFGATDTTPVDPFEEAASFQFYNEGGMVEGPEMDADIVNVKATPGEHVLSNEQIEMLESLSDKKAGEFIKNVLLQNKRKATKDSFNSGGEVRMTAKDKRDAFKKAFSTSPMARAFVDKFGPAAFSDYVEKKLK